MKKLLGLLILTIISCNEIEPVPNAEVKPQRNSTETITETSLIILGTIQDAGSPHIACKKDCCKHLFQNPDNSRKVVSLGLIDPVSKKTFIIEASPDLPQQMKNLKLHATFAEKETPDGILLTHAHIGHYTGLMYLGKEAMNADSVTVYAMPRMKTFLEQNGPWSQLVNTGNISLIEISDGEETRLSEQLSVTPFKVPHRDEYSETVGYRFAGPNKTALFIPDIDKWEKWDTEIIAAIARVDYAFIDGTFYDAEEINNRDISQIPHPFVSESMELFKNLDSKEKAKIHFIHFNHTNPIINPESEQYKEVLKNGFKVARMNDVIKL
tara:strand:- start:202 stop:1176 length:975 start_codon:yes stop_codon:yes gene_type:complete